MKKKTVNIILIVIMMLLALIASMDIDSIEYVRIVYIFLIGVGLILSFKTKKIMKTLVAGIYFMYISMVLFLSNHLETRSMFILVDGGFFLVPGILILFLVPQKKIKNVIIPSSILICCGIFLTLLAFLEYFKLQLGLPLFFVMVIICVGINIYVLKKR